MSFEKAVVLFPSTTVSLGNNERKIKLQLDVEMTSHVADQSFSR